MTRSGDYYMFEGSDSDEDDIDILAPSRPSEEEVETMGHATGPDPLQVKNLTKKDTVCRSFLISTWFPYGFAYVFVLDVELRGDEWQYQGHGAGYPGGEWAQWVGDGQRVCQSRPVPTLHAPSGSTRKCRNSAFSFFMPRNCGRSQKSGNFQGECRRRLEGGGEDEVFPLAQKEEENLP